MGQTIQTKIPIYVQLFAFTISQKTKKKSQKPSKLRFYISITTHLAIENLWISLFTSTMDETTHVKNQQMYSSSHRCHGENNSNKISTPHVTFCIY
jgi:hypothetical protein